MMALDPSGGASSPQVALLALMCPVWHSGGPRSTFQPSDGLSSLPMALPMLQGPFQPLMALLAPSTCHANKFALRMHAVAL